MGGKKRKSRKHSYGKEPSRPRKGFTLFLDESVDFDEVSEALTAARVRHVRHRDKFKSGADDQTLLAFVGKEKLVFVTTDQRQRSRHVEREQIKLHKVRQFVFTSGNMGKTVLIKALMNACHQMRRCVPPTAALSLRQFRNPVT